MKIFITYNRVSKEAVLSLVKDLEEMGHNVWFDNEISGGQSWWDNILLNIRNCDVYVFALNNIYITIANVQYVNYTNATDKDTIFKLLKAINNLPPAPALPEPLPEPPQVPISYLDNLKDKIDSPDLDKRDQFNLVNELKNKLTDPDNKKEDIYDLLNRLKRRDDLLASVYLEIDNILKNEPPQPNPTPKPKPIPNPPRPPYNPPKPPAQTQQGWSTGLMIGLGFLSFLWPLGIIIGIIAFTSGATKTQAWTLMGIALGVMCLYLLGRLALVASYY